MLRFALIGCGRIAKRHADLLSSAIEGASLVAVCDSNAMRADQFGETYKVNAYHDYHEMMTSEDIDVVSILTPSGLHAKHCIDIAPYGKTIIVEKPMALTLEDADAMNAATAAHNCRLFVVKQNRFNVPVMKLREALDAGRFGKLVLGTVRVRWCRPQAYYDQDEWRGTWAFDGGVLTNQASHHIDLLEWMMGDIESVFAYSSTALSNIETEDTAIALLKFKNGAIGTIEATTATRPSDLEGSISILGETGSVVVGGFAVNKIETWRFTPETADDKYIEEFSVNPPDVYGFGHKSYYEHVVDCLTNDATQLVDGAEGKRSLQLIHAIYKSIETGKEVSLESISHSKRLGVLHGKG